MFSSAFFLPEWAAVSVEEAQKGWVRDLISSGGRRDSAPLWNGCTERSAGISWGSCWAILCCSPVIKQPCGLQAATARLDRTVYFERTLNPAQLLRCLCFPLCLILTLQHLITTLPTGASAKLAIWVHMSDVTLNPDESAGRISALLCL